MSQHQLTRDRVRAALQQKLETEALDINVNIRGNEVVLTGVADNLADKLAAENAVRSLPGVSHVENAIVVSTDGTVTDKEIVKAAERKLRANNLPVVGIESHQGVVDVYGKVADLDTANAVKSSIEEVTGVTAVYNHMEMPHDEYSDDITIVDEIERLLVNEGLDSPELEVNCVEGEVELVGEVESRDDIARIENVVSKVPGVQRIVNRLRERDYSG